MKVDGVFDQYKMDGADTRQSLVQRMATNLQTRFNIDENDFEHLESVIKMTYDWGVMEGIEFSLGMENSNE